MYDGEHEEVRDRGLDEVEGREVEVGKSPANFGWSVNYEAKI